MGSQRAGHDWMTSLHFTLKSTVIQYNSCYIGDGLHIHIFESWQLEGSYMGDLLQSPWCQVAHSLVGKINMRLTDMKGHVSRASWEVRGGWQQATFFRKTCTPQHGAASPSFLFGTELGWNLSLWLAMLTILTGLNIVLIVNKASFFVKKKILE